MIAILRITSLVVAVLAVLVFGTVLGWVPSFNSDGADREAAEKVLNSPSAIERFNKQHGGKSAASQDKTPPLIQQAQLLAEVLNPPPPPQPPTTSREPVTASKTPMMTRPPSVKFDLVGTSYCAANPADSFAYIRLPGNEYRWVQQGSEVDRMVVKEVKSGSVVLWDGRETSEVPVEPTPDTASLLEQGGTQTAASTGGVSRPAVRARTPSGVRDQSVAVRRPSPATTRPSSPDGDDEEQKRMTELVNKLRELQRKAGGGGGEADAIAQERAELTKKLISEYKSSQVSEEEAERLEDLGEELSGTRNKSVLDRRREFMRRMGARTRDPDDDDH